MTWLAVPLAVATAVSTVLGGLVAFRLRKELATVIAFTGGIVVAVALFDVLPEALDLIVERVLVLHHRDEPEQARAHARVGALGAAGLSLHSFLDGLGIGLALHVNTATGLLVFLAVISHDFADGMNTVSFVLRQSDDGSRSTPPHHSSARSSAPRSGSPITGSATCWPPTPGSFCSSARPISCPRRTATRRGVVCCWCVCALRRRGLLRLRSARGGSGASASRRHR